MRRRLQTTRVTLREARLPSAAENTELNYRTRITTDRQETATTIRLASIFTLVFIACGFGIRLFAILPLAWGLTVLGLLAAIMLGTAYAKFLQSRPPWSDIGWCLGFVAACVMFGVTTFAPRREMRTSSSLGSRSQGPPRSRTSSQNKFGNRSVPHSASTMQERLDFPDRLVIRVHYHYRLCS